MGNTHFSGPVVSTAGFTGDLTGLVFGGKDSINASGAIPVTSLFTVVGPDGSAGSAATALTLANGTAGQMKVLKYQDGTATTNAVVTPANLVGYSTLTFNLKSEYAILISDGSSWHVVVSTATLG